MVALLTKATHGADLIDPHLFDRLVSDVQRDHARDRATSARIVDQSLVYLVACSHTPSPISPTPLVDLGWHAFILRTSEYREFCRDVLGGFIDHHPNDARPNDAEREATAERTLRAVLDTGLHVEHDLWTEDAGCSSCTDTKTGGDGDGCHQGCHDSKVK
ncbi:hypothetical protein BJF83_02340 [Nocardiopsis sp. CNR-923]|uniref:glycine-rich domain-containing protein n=1 Tax=Nocardiopsis sp. CNR-923 TaxID=1904965 RepID=UPI00095D2D6D|nr:hypothetical protein [Nocardiopsis sp. CNR-923]OLT27416.1 hypothetical protein BJF83_02340 [Nocardiopsis sp. CNR-923]